MLQLPCQHSHSKLVYLGSDAHGTHPHNIYPLVHYLSYNIFHYSIEATATQVLDLPNLWVILMKTRECHTATASWLLKILRLTSRLFMQCKHPMYSSSACVALTSLKLYFQLPTWTLFCMFRFCLVLNSIFVHWQHSVSFLLLHFVVRCSWHHTMS